jgi:hypothetical protein
MLEILVLEVADMDVLCLVRKEGREIIEIAMLCGRDLSAQVRKGNSRR